MLFLKEISSFKNIITTINCIYKYLKYFDDIYDNHNIFKCDLLYLKINLYYKNEINQTFF